MKTYWRTCLSVTPVQFLARYDNTCTFSQQGNTHFKWGRACLSDGKGQNVNMAMVDADFWIWWQCGIKALLYVSKIQLIVSPYLIVCEV